ncbi:MAG: nitrogenase [Deltaproteobacteria bacterium]|jgi:nitrogenase molybdenum-iron protein alpha chain|nr:nitrogenase [Deltaproteobacteria bacterium]
MANFEAPKIILDNDTSPKREDSLNTIKAYSGKVSQFLDDVNAGRELQWKDRKFEQTSQCMLTQVVNRVLTIRDSVLVIHGPVGCSQGSYGYRELYRNVPLQLQRPRFQLNILSTNLTEGDIVFGGEKKLKLAIETAVERYNPKSIIIAASCASGIMGDDIEGVVESIQPNIEARIIPIHCEGFRSEISQSGFDATAHAVVKYLVKPPKRKQKDLVNIIAPFSVTWADRVEFTRLFDKVGLRPRFIPDFATTEELMEISEAAVTAPTCPSYGLYLQAALKEKFGVPYFREPAPLGLTNTKEWFRQIAKHTGKEREIESLIAEEEAYVLPKLEEFKKEFKGVDASVFVSAGQARAVFIPKFVVELGMKIAGVNTLELDPYIATELQAVYDQVGDFEIHASDIQPFEQSHMLEKMKPDLYTGCPFMGLYKREGGHVRNHSYRSDFSIQSQQFSFRGILNYGNVIQRALKNPSLNKTLRAKRPRPYKDWWYEQEDVLKYANE